MTDLALAGLSAPRPTVREVMHPWRRLRALVHIDLVWHDPVPGAPMGETDFEAGTISLRRGMSQAERRSTVLHECLHVERGPALDTLEGREEQRVRRETARLLLSDVRAVGEALAWAHTLEEAAEELWVDVGVLADRLRWLHPAERHFLRRRLHAEDGA